MRVSKLMSAICAMAGVKDSCDDSIFFSETDKYTHQQTTTLTFVSQPHRKVDIDLKGLETYITQQIQLQEYVEVVKYWVDRLNDEDDSDWLTKFKRWMYTYGDGYLGDIAAYNEMDEPFFKLVKGYAGFLETHKYSRGAEDMEQVAGDVVATIGSLYHQIPKE